MNSISRRRLAVFGADQLLAGHSAKSVARQLAAVLVESHREKDFDLLVSDVATELELRGKVAQVSVTTATALSDQLRRQIDQFTKKNAKVEHAVITENIDKSVLGGVRIETATYLWDKTVTKKLSALREVF